MTKMNKLCPPSITQENTAKISRTAYSEKTSVRECLEFLSPAACCFPSSVVNYSCWDENLKTCKLYSPCEVLRNNSTSSDTISPPETFYRSLTKNCSETNIYNISDHDCLRVCSYAIFCFSSLVYSFLDNKCGDVQVMCTL